MKRKAVSRRTSQRIFRATATRHHPLNTRPAPKRGGIRL